MYFNPLDKFCKSITGAIKENQSITFRVKGEFSSCTLVVRRDDSNNDEFYPMDNKGDFFEKEVSFSRGLYWYWFSLGDGRSIGLSKDYVGEITDFPQGFQLSVFAEYFSSPSWLNGGIIYQIFPDRFNVGDKDKIIEEGRLLHLNWKDTPIFKPNAQGQVMNNDFFGGDFKGITEKLDYLESLGVSAIYLNPIFKAYSNHRYDTGDYMQFDSMLGTQKDFENLLKKAQEKGIKIILDGVFNHTGDDSLYFNKYGNYTSVGAYQSQDSPYKDWFRFVNYPNEYESWWGIQTLPAVNKTSGFVDFITGKDGVLEKYTKMGIGGWRLDVVDELPGDFVKKIRSAVKGVNNDAIVIGEVWEDATNKISYGARREYFIGDELDSVMNYPLKNAIIDFVCSNDCKNLAFTIKEQIDHYPKHSLNILMNILATHDTFRLLSAVSGVNVLGKSKEELANLYLVETEYERAKNRLKTAVLLQYTLYGVPSVYYGDEIGMQGYTDPLNRKAFSWDCIDNEILDFYQKLGKIRRENSAFIDGEFKSLFAKGGVFAFTRENQNSEVAVIINLSNDAKQFDFNGKLKDLLTNETFENSINILPSQYVVLVNA